MAETTKAINAYFKGLMAEDSVLLGGHTAGKQVSGGPERLGFLNSVSNRVLLASFLAGEANARLLIDAQGNFEWGQEGLDQDTLLYHAFPGRMNLSGMGGGGLGVVAWKHTRLNGAIDATQLTLTVASSTGFSVDQFFRIENETFRISGINGTTWTVTRGLNGTAQVPHADLSVVSMFGVVEAHTRIVLSNDGSGVLFGGGAAPPETGLYRSDAGILNMFGPTSGAFGILVTGDDYHRIVLENSGGGIVFGDGVNPPDVRLKRAAVNELSIQPLLDSAGVFRVLQATGDDAFRVDTETGDIFALGKGSFLSLDIGGFADVIDENRNGNLEGLTLNADVDDETRAHVTKGVTGAFGSLTFTDGVLTGAS